MNQPSTPVYLYPGTANEPVDWLTRYWLAVGGVLICLYLLFRLPYLLSFPLFNDELFYMLRGSTFPEWLWMSLIAGKFLHENLLGLLLQLPGDPLLISRLFTVACGLGVLIGILLIARTLEQAWAGVVAGVLYAGAPNAVLHDRFGIPETMLAWVGCFVLLASIHFARTNHPTRRQAAGVGVLIGVANLVKISGLFFAAMPVVAVLVLTDPAERRKRLGLLRMTVIVALLCIAVLAPFNYGGAESGRVGLSSAGMGERVVVAVRNVGLVASWLLPYLPGILLVFPLVPLLWPGTASAAQVNAVRLLLGSSFAISAAYIVVGQAIYPRYLLSVWPLLLLACAVGAVALWQMPGRMRLLNRMLCGAVLVGTLAWDGYFAIQIMTNPLQAPLVASDRRQYLENWTAGHNIPTMMALLQEQIHQQEEIIIIKPLVGGKLLNRLVHLAPQLYFHNNPHVRFAEVDILAPEAPQQVRELAQQAPTYILLDEQEYQGFAFARRFPDTQRLYTFTSPTGTMRFYIYQIR